MRAVKRILALAAVVIALLWLTRRQPEVWEAGERLLAALDGLPAKPLDVARKFVLAIEAEAAAAERTRITEAVRVEMDRQITRFRMSTIELREAKAAALAKAKEADRG
jgi:hypothetical protein